MRIGDNTVVTLTYELKEGTADGELMEIMNVKYPFQFLFGNGNLLPAFEQNIKGLRAGDNFEFLLKANEAYGQPEEGNVVNVPKTAFMVDGEIPEGLLNINQQVTVQDDTGDKHTGTILEFDENNVRVDFNHYMAGKDLHFKGTVLDVRKATVDEIIRKHHIPQH